jgi:hypothetical protein
MADNIPEIETVADRTRRYIQYDIDTKEREIAALRAYVDGLRKAKSLVEDVGDEIKTAWDNRKKVDMPTVA